MKLYWRSGDGFVELDGRRCPLHDKPYMPFKFDAIAFDDDKNEANITLDGLALDMGELQRGMCEDFIIDAFDGGLAGT